MTDRNDSDLDRQRIECVFGLGGGELHAAHPDFPGDAGWDGPDGIAYWYEGVPDYLSLDELGLGHDDEVRTAIIDCLFGHPDPPDGWEQAASFTSSGERECWWCGSGTDWDGSIEQDRAREADPLTPTGYRGNPACKLCEGDGVVYLGDGWAEVVYRRVETTTF